VVAPHRGLLTSGDRSARATLLNTHWDGLVAKTWEDLCRQRLPRVRRSSRVGRLGPWGPGARWWRGDTPEWDLVAETQDRQCLLLGEVKWSMRPLSRSAVERLGKELLGKPAPPVSRKRAAKDTVRVLFVPDVEPGVARAGPGFLILTGVDII
jgi:hypothetical protein